MESTTLRLPEDLVRAADRIAERRRVTRSDVIRDALEEYCVRAARSPRPTRAEIVAELVDYSGSGIGDLGRDGEAYLRKRFRGRRPRSR